MSRSMFVVALALIVGSALSGCAARASAEWNQWRGPQRDGVAVDSPPLVAALPPSGLAPVWTSAKIPSAWTGGWGSPVVADGKVFLHVHSRARREGAAEPERKYPWLEPDERPDWSEERFAEYESHRRDEDEAIGKSVYSFRETLVAIDAATGETAYECGNDSLYTRFLQSATPAVVDGRVYLLGAAYTVRCLRAADGEQLWERRVPGEFRDEPRMASIAVVDGVAIVQAGRLFGLDAARGDVLWEGDAERTAGAHSSPVVWTSGGRRLVIANSSSGHTVCLEPRTGGVLWSVETGAELSTPVVAGDRLITFGNSRKKGLRSFRLTVSGAIPEWTYNGLADKGSSPVVVGGHVFAQGARRLACVDLATGEERWATDIARRNPQFTSLIAADGKIFYTSEGLLMFAASGEGFRPLVDARADENGVLATEEAHRRRLGLDEIEQRDGGSQQAAKLWQEKVERHGPLECASAAFVDGRLIVRLEDGIACWDLREAVAGGA